MIYHFYIELEGSNPLVWRRIIVPANYSLYKLHMAIQGAFGWENCHLFQFSENDFGDKLFYAVPYDGDEADPEIVTIDARKAKISKVFREKGQTFFYVYDLGDYWTHRIIFEKTERRDMYSPYCLGGAGACPPEDVGGIRGYNSMLETLQLPDDPEKSEYREWLGLAEGENWDPAFCNIREVNKRLCLLE